ncbi:hypothetical protein V5F77_26860 [Xanthobacter sp. DSM 24535]|uniref:hypothetical protein n=1 Tax=Roseixanthobacter psychrophilus TaxID=3119917 RepID=UPI003729FA65
MVGAQRRLGIMDEATYEKITARHLGEKALPTEAPMTGASGRTLAKPPALALLNVIRRRGIEALH